jgi:hypothetical protein
MAARRIRLRSAKCASTSIFLMRLIAAPVLCCLLEWGSSGAMPEGLKARKGKIDYCSKHTRETEAVPISPKSRCARIRSRVLSTRTIKRMKPISLFGYYPGFCCAANEAKPQAGREPRITNLLILPKQERNC